MSEPLRLREGEWWVVCSDEDAQSASTRRQIGMGVGDYIRRTHCA